MDIIWKQSLSGMESFQLQDVVNALRLAGTVRSSEAVRKDLKRAVDAGELIKLGRNRYCFAQDGIGYYAPAYSAYARGIAELLQARHPYLDYSIFELTQLNEFVNHQIANNAVFVSVEAELAPFVFETLRDRFPGKVLLFPTMELYQQYWCEDMIVITKLFSQRPVKRERKWQPRIEMLLVDLFADSLLQHVIGESEYPAILEGAFQRYAIDENSLFRYEKRRTADKRIRQLIQEQTTIVLRTKE